MTGYVQEKHVNSRTYWEQRFIDDWEANLGREQTRFFCGLAIRFLPAWLTYMLRREQLTICDWGCALGDGTDLLAQTFANCSVTGVDFAETAINKARGYYPNLTFRSENFLAGSQSCYDVMFSSNTLEHFSEPWGTFEVVAGHATKCVILLLPFAEFPRTHEHCITFEAANIPVQPSIGWHLVYSKVIEVQAENKVYWDGSQILLVYATPDVVLQSRLMLADMAADGTALGEPGALLGDVQRLSSAISRTTPVPDTAAASEQMEAAMAAKNAAQADRDRAMVERDVAMAEIELVLAEKNAAIADRDDAIAARKAAVAERDAAMAERGTMLAEKNKAIADISARIAERNTAVAEREMGISERDAEIHSLSCRLALAQAQRDEAQAAFNRQKQKMRKLRKTVAWRIFGHLIHFESNFAKLRNRRILRPDKADIVPEKRTLRAGQASEMSAWLPQVAVDETSRIARLRRTLDLRDGDRLLVYPLSYPMDMRQRPEQLIRALSKLGFKAVVVTIEATDPFIRVLAEGVFLTNDVKNIIQLAYGYPDTTLYISYCRFAHLSTLLPRAHVIYDILDDVSIMGDYSEDLLVDHYMLLHAADLAIFSSRPLYERFAAHASSPMLVENAVDPDDFALPLDEPAIRVGGQEELIVGYVGAISELLDFNIFDRIAASPEFRLVLVGPVATFGKDVGDTVDRRLNALVATGKCELVGKVQYEQLRRIVAGFDVAVVPFRRTRETHAVNPIKLYEYLAAGKPVVATSLDAITSINAPVAIADTPETFVGAIHRVATRAPMFTQKAAEFVERNTWMVRAQQIEQRLGVLRPKKPALHILNVQFFDFALQKPHKGGAERYILDLAALAQCQGYHVTVLQAAYTAASQTYKHLRVVGLPVRINGQLLPLHGCSGTALGHLACYYSALPLQAEVLVVSPLEIAAGLSNHCSQRRIGVNHGIYWDQPSNRLSTIKSSHHEPTFAALAKVDACVAVDTNFLNWTRTIDFLFAKKVRYVPNYVNRSLFTDTEKDFDNDDVVILFPRTLYDARGLSLLLDSAPSVLEAFPQVRFSLAGQIASDASLRKKLTDFLQQFLGRVTHQEFDPDDMPHVYHGSQIVLIPTVNSEGTSLACLEAMATNNAVIATDVGGLPNLIVDHFNGLLISPSADSLAAAMKELVGNRPLRIALAQNALRVSAAFTKEKWEAQWSRLIGTRDTASYAHS